MKRIFSSLIFILLLAGIITVQSFFDHAKARAPYVEPMILRPDLVKAVDLGLNNAAADLMWLGAIQYFGGGESANNTRLPDYLNFTADVDPQFSYPYAFGALILPSIGYTDEGLALAQKGIGNGVEDWRIPYYAATTYYINKKDNLNAAKYFDITAHTSGVPDGIKTVSLRFGNQPDKIEQTIQIWTGIYETTNDDVVKARAEKYILHLRLLQVLNTAKDQYFNTYKKNPTKISDLVDAKIIRMIPEDPLGLTFDINEEGKIVVK